MYANSRQKHLERSFRRRDAVHALHQRENADFTDCPRPPVHCTDCRFLKDWRQVDWAGSPGLQIALSLDNETLLWAYRRIWGRTPIAVLKDKDFYVSRPELLLIAFHACGYQRQRGGPRMKQVLMEIPDGAFF